MKLKEQCIQDSQDIKSLQQKLHKNLLLLSDPRLAVAYDKIISLGELVNIYDILEDDIGLTSDDSEEIVDRLFNNGILNDK